MSREWKPGDVAIGQIPARPGSREDAYDTVLVYSQEAGWSDSRGEQGWRSDFIENLRPLVVIDAEDHEQVERLARAIADTGVASDWRLRTDVNKVRAVDGVAKALREFANPTPPKPDEPMGLGAAVELADGRLAVRTWQPHQPWSHFRNGLPFLDAWSDIDAVKVLAQGVSS